MGDECNCEKCGVNSLNVQDAVVWRVGRTETPTEGHGRTVNDQYLVVGKGGIALRQKAAEGAA